MRIRKGSRAALTTGSMTTGGTRMHPDSTRFRRVNLLHAHGSPTQYHYVKYGCRCGPCRGARRDYDISYRKTHAAQIRDYMHEYRQVHFRELDAYRESRKASDAERSRRIQRGWTETLRILKMAQGCVLCGKRDGRLVHHHLDPAGKKQSVSQMSTFCIESIIEEISKCTVLCTYHHAEYHRELKLMEREAV
jgi:hypothetical protein